MKPMLLIQLVLAITVSILTVTAMNYLSPPDCPLLEPIPMRVKYYTHGIRLPLPHHRNRT